MTRTVEIRTGLGSILVEQAPAMARDVESVNATARLGREPTRRALEAGLPGRGELVVRRRLRPFGGIRRRREAAPSAADGEAELLGDGGMAPGRDGWRKVKMASIRARPRGKPARPEEWADREPPPPATAGGAAFEGTADGDAFAATRRGRAEGSGNDSDGPRTVRGDGAAWIRRAAGERPGSAAGRPDIFHAWQHLAAAADALHGEGTTGAAV